VFQYRFNAGEGLNGHSFGNLFLTALTKVTGSFLKSVEITSAILKIKGKIIPSTEEMVNLVARFSDKKLIQGESQITEYGKQLKGKIKKIWLEPGDVKAPREAVEKLRSTDFLIFGPGSLYTSIVPNLLVKEIKQAILKSKAYRIYICNIMTQYGETDGYAASDHVRSLHKAMGKRFIDAVVINTRLPRADILERYRSEHAEPVAIDTESIATLGVMVYSGDLLEEGSYVRHDSRKLAEVLSGIMERQM
jgi:uncharacterized cofD-like protein